MAKDPSGTMSAAWSAGRLAAQMALTLIVPGLEQQVHFPEVGKYQWGRSKLKFTQQPLPVSRRLYQEAGRILPF
jgi:hypothetical protein